MPSYKTLVLSIVGRCRAVGWDVEMGDSSKWYYKITPPDGRPIYIHHTPSDRNWHRVTLRALDEGGRLTEAEEEAKQRAALEKAAKQKIEDAKNKRATALAEARSKALVRAKNPGIVEADLGWLLAQHPMPEMRTILMTPDVAGKLLDEINTHNRKRRQDHYDFFVRMLQNGEWACTHQGMAIDWNGILQDGQHRLEAIRDTGISVPVRMFVGEDPDNFNKIDTQMPRRAQDLIAMRGVPNSAVMGSIARLVLRYDEFGGDLHLNRRAKYSIAAVDEAVASMGEPLRAACLAAYRIREETYANVTGTAAALYVIARMLPDGDSRVERFIYDLERGVTIERSDVVDKLRRRFIRARRDRQYMSGYEAMAYVIKTWNHRLLGQTTQPTWRATETFPAPLLPAVEAA